MSFYLEYREKDHDVETTSILEFKDVLEAEAKIIAMILDARIKVSEITGDALESVNYYDNKFTGIAEVVSNDGSYSFFWKRLWVVAKNKGWILTDDDCAQYVRNTGRTYQFELIQYELVDPDKCMYAVRTDEVNILDYLTNQDQFNELSRILRGFGYEDMDELKREFLGCAPQVAAECIFESEGPDLSGSCFVGSEEDCEKFIAGYVATH